jgi:hypothetical protein
LDEDVGQVCADDSDPGAGVQEESNGLSGVWVEAEAEEGDGAVGADDVAVDERAAVARGSMHSKDGAVGAEDVWERRENHDESEIAEAGFREDVFALALQDDGFGEEWRGV